tara:strand:+ start:6497 stop:7255 length:759 start_codon:yes stop_codon:yes gene_type:complete
VNKRVVEKESMNILEVLFAIKNIPAIEIDQKLHNLYGDKTCAVVGSAGKILDYEHGSLIDEHDIVIRCNQAPSDKYERYVGSRTDIRLINSHYFTALKGNRPPSHARFIPSMKRYFPLFDENFLYSLKDEILVVKYGVDPKMFDAEIRKIEENNSVYFMNNGFYSAASQIVGAHATNGFVAILFALKYFSSVSCFGFTFCSEMHTPDWDKLYYFMPAIQPDNWKETDCHSNLRESELISEMLNHDVLKFYKC